MKGGALRPRSAANKGKNVIPLSLRKILTPNPTLQPTPAKQTKPKLFFPDISFTSDNVQSPKAILKSFENFGLTSAKIAPLSTKCSMAEPSPVPGTPDLFSRLSLKSPSPVTPVSKTPLPRSPIPKSPTLTIRFKEKSAFDEGVYQSLKEKTQVYYTSPNVESDQRTIAEETMQERITHAILASQLDLQKSVSKSVIGPVRNDRAREISDKVESHIKRQKRRQVKDEVLRKILCEANNGAGSIKMNSSLLTGTKENANSSKAIKVVRLKRSENKGLRMATTNTSKVSIERSESPKLVETSVGDNDTSNDKLYKSIRLKYLVDPNAEEMTKSGLQLKVRSIVCETIDKEAMKANSVSVGNLFKGQSFATKFIKIENKSLVKDNEEEKGSRKSQSVSEKYNVERTSGRCALKERKVSELVEELKLANSLMLKESIVMDRSRISKSSLKPKRNNSFINLYPSLAEVDSCGFWNGNGKICYFDVC